MILLMGTTGRVGGSCARYLLNEGVDFRAMGRQAEPPSWLADADWRQADLRNPASLVPAFDGVTRVLLVAPNAEDQVAMECAVADQAAASGVELLVKISSTEVGSGASAPFPAAHTAVEAAIAERGIPACMLRPDFFFQNLLMSAPGIKAAGDFRYPFGDAQVAPLDARDVGEAAARILLGEGHAGQVYALTGSALMNFHEVAAGLSEGLGRDVRYVAEAPEAYREFLLGVIPDRWHAEAVSALFDDIREQHRSQPSRDLEQILGRPPRSVAAFAAEHAAAFNP